MVYIELEYNINKLNSISINTIIFYIEFIATIPKENDEKNNIIIEFFDEIIENFIILINSFVINSEHYSFYNNSFKKIYNYLYNSDINFENDKFNNKNLINNIKKSFEKYIFKFLMFELDIRDYKAKEIRKNYILQEFLINNNILKKGICNKAINLLKKFFIIYKKKLSKKVYFTIKEKNLLKLAFGYDFIDINDIKVRNLVLEFLKIFLKKLKNLHIMLEILINLLF